MKDNKKHTEALKSAETLRAGRDQWRDTANTELAKANAYRDERDALAAHVERLREAEASHQWDEDRLSAMIHALEDAPETSLARRDARLKAEALEKLPTGAWLTLDDAIECVDDFVVHYRRQAGGGES